MIHLTKKCIIYIIKKRGKEMRYVSPMSKIIAQRLHEVVLDGELGIDYTFAGDRAKNIALRRKCRALSWRRRWAWCPGR